MIATLSAKGAKDGMTTRDTTELMATLLGLQANDLLAAEYARQVLSLSYRRRFRRCCARSAHRSRTSRPRTSCLRSSSLKASSSARRGSGLLIGATLPPAATPQLGTPVPGRRAGR
ncbi:hypothetical protein CKJ84_06355 [Corynebacterium sp. NML 120412]|nr:hypothetical protein CKJ84_06355 [Corynebacterium sp. NML 120412]